MKGGTGMGRGVTVGKVCDDPSICGWCKWCEEVDRSAEGRRMGECYALPPSTATMQGFVVRHVGPKVTLDRKACGLYERRIV